MIVQNNKPATAKKLGGATGKGFMPGRSGNPGGRAKGLSAIVREKTRGGVLIYDELLKIGLEAKDERTRLEALKLLAAYGFGTPGTAQVEWDEARVKEAATQLGKDPEQMLAAWRTLRGEKSA